ncbi:hypothetical protein BKA61DRAFT_583145 [Leptodontidium sp. MPI-SDFR-AT-0119]|nr:hypothetical protein BKA61DRAFT_583145 [Leptodontidium sp. MPI-SDFR-AT-0119]
MGVSANRSSHIGGKSYEELRDDVESQSCNEVDRYKGHSGESLKGDREPSVNLFCLLDETSQPTRQQSTPPGSSSRGLAWKPDLWTPGACLKIVFLNGSSEDQREVKAALDDFLTGSPKMNLRVQFVDLGIARIRTYEFPSIAKSTNQLLEGMLLITIKTSPKSSSVCLLPLRPSTIESFSFIMKYIICWPVDTCIKRQIAQSNGNPRPRYTNTTMSSTNGTQKLRTRRSLVVSRRANNFSYPDMILYPFLIIRFLLI